MKTNLEIETVKLLLVDDEPVFIRTMTDIIEKSNINSEILQAFDGKSALMIAREEIPHIILTDWEMPEMNGIEFIKALHHNEITSEIPVIMVTGSMITPKDLELALDSGAVDYVRKPIDGVELMARINSMLLLTQYYKDKVRAEQKEQQLLVENLERAKRELVSSSMQLVNKNNLLLSLKEQIEETRCNENRSQVNSLCRFIDQSMKADNDWEQFKQHFELVHQDFFLKLAEICPEVTAHEKKLCAYYRINLSTNEIASILNITSASAKKSRHRLRQKLNLATDQDIVQFLEGI